MAKTWFAMIRIVCLSLGIALRFSSISEGQSSVQEELVAEGASSLAKAARAEGDAQRGAILFHQPLLACAKCHTVGQAFKQPTGSRHFASLGPDLTKPDKTVTAESIVESVLEPSKVLKKGFEPVVIQTTDGKTVTGLLVEETVDKLVLRDVGQGGQLATFSKSEIEDRAIGKTSIMPSGQVNALANRQQFLDLARYLVEIAEGGLARAQQLQPPPSLFAYQLPEYEKQIDHAGMLRDLDTKSFQRGEAIYNRLCINCHGTKDQPGSLPTSLKFAEGRFKNGADPWRMYQTLTHGFGLMAAQTWMIPQQKYDVIHYVRETYLKPHNPSQYAKIDNTYLASLPQGNTRGPAPSNVEPWSSMNYGPFLTATYEVGSDGTNFAHKGIAVRLDPGPGGVSRGEHWMVFDHDTLRVAAAWSRSKEEGETLGHGNAGKETSETSEKTSSPSLRASPSPAPVFIDWRGINFDGRHNAHPRVSGVVAFANPTGPGWANPETGSFDDPRVLGRDGRRYGPLPREWGRYRGLYQHGEQVILSYTVGKTEVLELPGHTSDSRPMFTRTFHVGPRPREMLLLVATHPSADAILRMTTVVDAQDRRENLVASLSPSLPLPSSSALAFNGQTRVDIAKSDTFDLTNRDYSITARIKTAEGGTIFCQTPHEGPWTPNGKTLFVRGGRLCFDIGWAGVLQSKSKVDDGQWHNIAMTWQSETGRVQLYIDGRFDSDGVLKPRRAEPTQVIRLGFTSPNFPEPTFFVGQIAESRFYQRLLNLDELKAIPQQASEAVKQEDRLVALWKPAAASGDVVRDETGHGHDGRVTGASVAPKAAEQTLAAVLSPAILGSEWRVEKGGRLLLRIPPGQEPLKFALALQTLSPQESVDPNNLPLASLAAMEPTSLTKGGSRRWPEVLKTQPILGPDNGPFAVDVLTPPDNNPWFAQMRLTGFDFFEDGDRAAVCSWDGDVWIVSGLARLDTSSAKLPDGERGRGEEGETKTKSSDRNSSSPSLPISPSLSWQRITTGLFQPLGLKVVEGQIYVTCRDQIAILRDRNGDDETDFVECFNSDHQVTEHFHEFAMGLQTDADGNFYYAKSARHALPAVVPHHGTLLRVSKDGSRTDILANGFRAANGVCLNPDGTFVVTDQEGHWNPKNRINWVTPAKEGERPRFYGNLFGYHDVTDPSDSAMQPPLCWITNAFDRSPAELLWVTSDKWGPLKGSLLNLSYGYGKVFVVPHESVPQAASLNSSSDEREDKKAGTGWQSVLRQGGLCELPMPQFPTGIMRGRFHPTDGQLYVCGMFAWAGNATQPGGFYRIRATGRPTHAPIVLKAAKNGLSITFTEPLDETKASDATRYTIKTWSLKRTADYGSKHYDERTLAVAKASLSNDRRTVLLELPDIRPTWSMSIEYKLTGSNGEPANGLIHNTIHELGE